MIALPAGEYFIYASGEVWFESDRDWESGVEEGDFEFNVCELIIKKMPEEINKYDKNI